MVDVSSVLLHGGWSTRPFLWQIGKIENTAYKKENKTKLTWLLKSILVLLEWFVSVQFLYRCIFNAHNLALNLLINKIMLIMPWSTLYKSCSLPKYTCTCTSFSVRFDRINDVYKAIHATKGHLRFTVEYLRCLHLLRILDDHSLKTVIPLAWKFNIIWIEKPRTCLLPMVPKCKIQSINRTVKKVLIFSLSLLILT